MRKILFIAVLIAISFEVSAQMGSTLRRDRNEFTCLQDTCNSETSLLDAHPNAYVAYSLRKLRQNYNGECMRVVYRPSNRVEDVGFFCNYIDTACVRLTANELGDTLVTISEWYDQSGQGKTLDCNSDDILFRQDTFVTNAAGSLAPIMPYYSVLFDTLKVNSNSMSLYVGQIDNNGVPGRYQRSSCMNDVPNGEGYYNWIQFTNGDEIQVYEFVSNGTDQEVVLDSVDIFSQNITFFYNNGNLGTIDHTDANQTSTQTDTIVTPFYICPGTCCNSDNPVHLMEFVIWESVQNVSGVRSNVNNYFNIY